MLSRSHCPAPEKYPRSSTLFHSHTSCPDKKLCEEAQFSPPVAQYKTVRANRSINLLVSIALLGGFSCMGSSYTNQRSARVWGLWPSSKASRGSMRPRRISLRPASREE